MIHVAAKSGKVANNTVCILGYTPASIIRKYGGFF